MNNLNDIGDLFVLLEKMTNDTKNDSIPIPSRRMQCIEKCFRNGFLFAISLFIVVAVCYYLIDAFRLNNFKWVILLYLLSLLFYISYISLIFLNLVKIRYQEPFVDILANLKDELNNDAFYLKALWNRDKNTLEYGLKKYRDRLTCFDERIAMLVGDFRKLGLIPSVAAAIVSAIPFMTNNFHTCPITIPSVSTIPCTTDNVPLWVPIILICGFCLMVSYGSNLRKRPKQVITLLEYAIQHYDYR